MKRATLILIGLVFLSGCEAGRRLYLSVNYKIVRIPTENMLPTIRVGDYAAVDTSYYSKNPVQRFDMIVVENPQPNEVFKGADKYILKRVIGLGGEQLEIKNGKVYIDGKELAQPFTTIPDEPRYRYGPVLIPGGDYFLMGDNRPNSLDSRFWRKPSVGKSQIYGKVVEVIPAEK